MEVIPMAVQQLDEITWHGRALLVAVATDNGHVICKVPCETIRVLRTNFDTIGREILFERRNIVEKLAPFSDRKAVADRCWRDPGAVAVASR